MVLIYVAILSLVLIGLAGIAVDSALVSSAGQELQNAADGAALNAPATSVGREGDLSVTAVRSAAMSVALANDAANTSIKLDANTSNAATGDIVVGHWDQHRPHLHPEPELPERGSRARVAHGEQRGWPARPHVRPDLRQEHRERRRELDRRHGPAHGPAGPDPGPDGQQRAAHQRHELPRGHQRQDPGQLERPLRPRAWSAIRS
jgi:hypothetical protein